MDQDDDSYKEDDENEIHPKSSESVGDDDLALNLNLSSEGNISPMGKRGKQTESISNQSRDDDEDEDGSDDYEDDFTPLDLASASMNALGWSVTLLNKDEMSDLIESGVGVEACPSDRGM
ncbi:hypothetical protein TREMEDRAFT_57964 [Tremella mesenterica DSM 1558]|uniref:uncharacterized protein n=1 Tax=Tremella mesenterica (strain ATCC 24925 / CBS 8224 / DSM 1558 / NBRC 9311 / NRRL Y-6157 / RJB 2259-6 / UBC 559-6) TaxID=578456 RepID=UPI00032CC3BD|nr:uncharacterized protein TREMEDRAFT_57964 [Tremella mesenterica DSM 1558]EIW65705.1 hypothetical protein TREMEDRAFT_57964 [Tremella mesenterica DSM 1558]